MITIKQPAISSKYLWILILLALTAYSLPWIINPGTILNPGAYDLAEWTSLHPTVRNNNPPLLTTLLLRGQLVLLALIVAANTPRPTLTRKWTLSALGVFVLAAASLPPFEYFTEARNDPNYRQQFLLTLGIIVGGTTGLSGRLYNMRGWLVMVFAIAGLTSSSIALVQALELMQQYQLPTQAGIGGMGLAALYAILLVLMAMDNRNNKQGSVL